MFWELSFCLNQNYSFFIILNNYLDKYFKCTYLYSLVDNNTVNNFSLIFIVNILFNY